MANPFNSPSTKARSRKPAPRRARSAAPYRTPRRSRKKQAVSLRFAAAGCILIAALAAGRQIYSSARGAAPAHAKLAARPNLTPAPKRGLNDLTEVPEWTRGRSFRFANTKEKVIALTFDDGPFPTYTKQVLEILKENDIRATFFMIGRMVKAYPKIAVTVRDAGHVIGNHSWGHLSKPKAPASEVDQTAKILKATLGETAPLFRPPYGLMHNGMADTAKQEKLSIILWNSAGADWSKKATARSIISQVMHYAEPGGIVLLHDGGGNRSATVAALPVVIEKLRAQGYRFVTVPELLAMSEKPSAKKKPVKTKKARATKITAKSSAKKPAASPLPAPVRPRPSAGATARL